MLPFQHISRKKVVKCCLPKVKTGNLEIYIYIFQVLTFGKQLYIYIYIYIYTYIHIKYFRGYPGNAYTLFMR